MFRGAVFSGHGVHLRDKKLPDMLVSK